MVTVYLHIGTMKTGTSALQSFLDENRELLEEQGYAYPRMKVGLPANFVFRNAHFLVHHLSVDSKKEDSGNDVEEKAYAQLGELAKQFEHIILSDETIWHRAKKDDHFWSALIDNFRKIGCQVKIILYLRRQDAVAESLYNQNVKSNRMLDKSLMEYLNGTMVKSFSLHYYEPLAEIERHLGKENICVRVYEKEQFEGGTIYSDFLHSVGLAFDDRYKIERPAANLGLQGNYIELKRVVNGLPEYKELNDFMARPLRAASAAKTEGMLHGKETLFEYDEQVRFMSGFEEENSRIAVEYLGREDGVLFREPLGTLPTWSLDRETLYQDVMMAMAETFCYQEKRLRKSEEISGESEAKVKDLEHRIQCLEEEIRGEKGLKTQVNTMYRSLIFRGYRKARKIVGHE